MQKEKIQRQHCVHQISRKRKTLREGCFSLGRVPCTHAYVRYDSTRQTKAKATTQTDMPDARSTTHVSKHARTPTHVQRGGTLVSAAGLGERDPERERARPKRA